MTDFVEQIYHNKKNYQGIIFLDRDGTVNETVAYLNKKSQLKILPTANEGIELLNKRQIAVVIITNQPSIARGLITINSLREINDELVKKFNTMGLYIDAIYSCPHHPEKNHDDIPHFAMKYRVDCNCRKPKIEMFEKAMSEYGHKRILGMIGDHERDILAGKNFGIKTVFLKNSQSESKVLKIAKPDYVCDNLLDAVKALL